MTNTLTDAERDRLDRMDRSAAAQLLGWMLSAGRDKPAVAAEIRAFLRCHPDAGRERTMDAPEADRSDSP